jgi:hypothetical protein
MNVAVQELETLDENEYVDHGVWALSEQSITRRRREHFRTAMKNSREKVLSHRHIHLPPHG